MSKVQVQVCPEPRLLGIKQAATYLSTTVWCVRSLIWDRKIPHVKLGKAYLLYRADLDRYVESLKVTCR